MEDKNSLKSKYKMIFIVLGVLLFIVITIGVTYAFFNYTRAGGENAIQTGTIIFDYADGAVINITNQFPIAENEITSNNRLTFTITSHNTLSNGISFNIYAVYGEEEIGKTRLLDSTMKMKFTPPSDGDGFSILTNNYATSIAPTFNNGEALIATGKILGTTAVTTKTYNLDLWLDSSLAFVSSTTKRLTLAEGNPSMAVATSGTVTATRYMKNDSTDPTTVTLYPARVEAQNKIIYTTNEFSNSYYSIRIKIVANDNLS